jgi:hypothetical protein
MVVNGMSCRVISSLTIIVQAFVCKKKRYVYGILRHPNEFFMFLFEFLEISTFYNFKEKNAETFLLVVVMQISKIRNNRHFNDSSPTSSSYDTTVSFSTLGCR